MAVSSDSTSPPSLLTGAAVSPTTAPSACGRWGIRVDYAPPDTDTIGPQMPYFRGGYPMEAPGVGIGNQEDFIYQCRAFFDQIAGPPDPLPANATFADALHTMEIIQAIVRSAQSDGAEAAVAPTDAGAAGASSEPPAPINPAAPA
jgi:hypothetical protein